ncbi:MAG: hypothetical protein PHO30_01180 [Candidatus Omnitrophica bacterium]|nr:hypothetical protein [Candidatus Omnitrophota bacterium]
MILFLFGLALAGNLSSGYAEDTGTAADSGQTLQYSGISPDETEEEEPGEADAEGDEVVVKGSYRFNLGFEDKDVIWKDANYLLQQGSWRYFYGEKRYNTYDPAVYNQVMLGLDVPIDEKVSFYAKIVIDPWSFVGTTRTVTLPTAYGTTPDTDTVELKLKYWSNSGHIYPEIVHSSQGDSFALPEIKVKNGSTEATSVNGNFGYYTHVVDIPSLEVDTEFKPMRALWVDVKEDEYRAVFFVYAEQNIAMGSDDPLALVNNHIVWEPSPWIDQWRAGKLYTATGWDNGTWQKDLALRDSAGNWLTLLRAARLEGEFAGIYSDFMIATPLDPWDEYSTVNNIPLALRLKKDLSDRFMVGATSASRWGYDLGSTDALDQVIAVDSEWGINEYHTLKAETAASKTARNLNNDDFKEHTDDAAYKVALESDMDPFDLSILSKLSYTCMGREFQSPLANYSYTRDDQSWGRHLAFYSRSEEEERYRIGNGVDQDRKVFGLDMRFGELEGLSTYFNFRNVNTATDDSFLENILRNETLYRVNEKLLTKFLLIYDNHKKNADGTDPDTRTLSAGFKYDFTEWLSWEEIGERTNEYPGYPDSIYDWMTINPEAPYPYYSLARSRLLLKHNGWLDISLEQTYNEFEYATTVDDCMNYSGVDIRWMLTQAVTAQTVYRYSRVADYGRDGKVIGHHNLFFDLGYQVDEYARLSLRFGSLGSYIEGLGWQSSVLDTQHLLQVIYEGQF